MLAVNIFNILGGGFWFSIGHPKGMSVEGSSLVLVVPVMVWAAQAVATVLECLSVGFAALKNLFELHNFGFAGRRICLFQRADLRLCSERNWSERLGLGLLGPLGYINLYFCALH